MISIFIAVLVFASAASGESVDKTDSETVSIEYVDPEKFTDLESTSSTKKNTRADFARSISKELTRRLRASFGEDARLDLVITDVDLAGRINPASFHDVRVLREVWPPKMEFSYKLTDADGTVISEGEKRLVDLGYLGFSISGSRHDRFHYEREMVKDWLRGLKRELTS